MALQPALLAWGLSASQPLQRTDLLENAMYATQRKSGAAKKEARSRLEERGVLQVLQVIAGLEKEVKAGEEIYACLVRKMVRYSER